MEEYIILEGETPEQVSFKYYGTTDYWWIIMITNNIRDVFYDWPMANSEVREYATEMAIVFPTDTDYNVSTLLTENDNKRFISVLKEEYLNILISDYLTQKSMGAVIIE